MNEDIRKNREIHEGDLENISGGQSLLAHYVPGLAENEANAQYDLSLSAIPGRPCPKCHSMMLPTVPIHGAVTSAPGLVCTTCGHTI
ncbi:MAG: hypothetical protein IJP04_05885 [Clostridia bacterium]|nr:hypothetical protein [Clostridia bacterium]